MNRGNPCFDEYVEKFGCDRASMRTISEAMVKNSRRKTSKKFADNFNYNCNWDVGKYIRARNKCGGGYPAKPTRKEKQRLKSMSDAGSVVDSTVESVKPVAQTLVENKVLDVNLNGIPGSNMTDNFLAMGPQSSFKLNLD